MFPRAHRNLWLIQQLEQSDIAPWNHNLGLHLLRSYNLDKAEKTELHHRN
jgi:hypothetical protein